MENLYTPNCIRTHSGLYFNILEPTLDMICIEDIAHALSHQCRFGGHLPRFYSVAQHSVLAAQMAKRFHPLAALLHDASEAYLLDIPKPIKPHLNNYETLEDRIMQLIAEKFGFKYPLPQHIHIIDRQLLESEWEHIMMKDDNYFESWPPAYAKQRFLETYQRIIIK